MTRYVELHGIGSLVVDIGVATVIALLLATAGSILKRYLRDDREFIEVLATMAAAGFYAVLAAVLGVALLEIPR